MIRITYFRICRFLLIGILIVLFPAFPAMADIEVTSGNINIGVVGENEFMAGYVVIPRVPVFWQSTEPWRLTVSSLDPDMGSSDDAMNVKALEDVLWRVSESEDWQSISINCEEVEWSNETGSGVVYIDIMVLLDWLTDSPGEYSIDVEFSIESI